jgi:hypothetical protein
VIWKHQIPSAKFQINTDHPNPKQNFCGHLKLEFGAYLGFACLRVGREFVILNSMRFALCSLQKGKYEQDCHH